MQDEDIEAEMAKCTDNELIRIVEYAPDPERLTRREELALGEMERRNIDF